MSAKLKNFNKTNSIDLSQANNANNNNNNNKSIKQAALESTTGISSSSSSNNYDINIHNNKSDLFIHANTNSNRNSLVYSNAAAISVNNSFKMNENEKILINEFEYLLEKSKQLFNGLRDLPQYGYKNNQWQAYFGRTFEVYTKLWKFQQENRQLLDQKYNLKRWQIGEIASKIGQLYYHYYLRTSESNYLNESFSFYQAIQLRSYYSKVNKEEKSDLMVKKLRYLARFIVVCLLLKKMKQVKELAKEFSRQIDDYVKTYDPEDQLEWQLVKNEVSEFIQADSIVQIDDLNTSLSNRLVSAQIPRVLPNSLENAQSKLTNSLVLQEILIVGNCQDQIKFSELSLDMFRMLQAVEREPSQSNEIDLKESANKSTTQSICQRDNPHKYLLYKPSFSQFNAYLSASFKELTPHSVMMIYLSADASESHLKNKVDHAFDYGGVRTNNKKENGFNSNQTESASNRRITTFKETHCIHPGDLYPFTRKPLLLIVDSSNSRSFQNFPNLFNQPFLSLLSPIQLPHVFHDKQNQFGNIFTLFLTSPLFAFCYVSNIGTLSNETLHKSNELLGRIFNEIARSIQKSSHIDKVFVQYSSDDFLRSFILRFIFCFMSLKLHRGFKGAEFYPSCEPHLPDDVLANTNALNMVLDLSSVLNVRPLFLDVSDF